VVVCFLLVVWAQFATWLWCVEGKSQTAIRFQAWRHSLCQG
jgi:hypothetical protein